MLKDFDYVSNSLKYEYYNGFTEGVNNFIKLLKRIAFSYKSFFHFRNLNFNNFKIKGRI